jgi:hypothetical protein
LAAGDRALVAAQNRERGWFPGIPPRMKRAGLEVEMFEHKYGGNPGIAFP